MERLSFEEAKRLSVKKWQMHVYAGGCDKDVGTDKELYNLLCHCGFCERHKSKVKYPYLNCNNCEFGKVAGVCPNEGSLHDEWFWAQTKENAQKILDVIKNLEE